MPVDPITGAIIATGIVNTIKGFFDSSNANDQEEKNRLQANEQFMLQRKWALEDWEKQNAYNHPLQQMQRLREAGLNPNLVYGKGADNTASIIRSSDAKPYSKEYHPADVSSLMNSLMLTQQVKQNESAMRLQSAQASNIDADTKLKQLEIDKKAQDVGDYTNARNNPFYQNPYLLENNEKVIEGSVKAIDYQIKEATKNEDINQKKLITKSIILDNANKIVDKKMKIAQTELVGTQREKVLEEVNLVKQNIKMLENQEYSQRIDQVFKSFGISPGDPQWTRASLKLILDTEMRTIVTRQERLKNYIKKEIQSNKGVY